MRRHPDNYFQPGDVVHVCGETGMVVHINGKGVKVVLPAWPDGVWFTYKEVGLVSTETALEIDATDLLALAVV